MSISKQVALDACLIQQKTGLIDSKIPVLVGQTSSGKTYWVQNILSKQLNLPVVKILLQNEQPDEILGYPKFVGNDTLEFLKPAWWTEQPSIFFFDELDKSRDELHASILTMLREGTIRGRNLPEGSVIVCAMNESNYLSDPLKARCIFVPFNYEQRQLDNTTLDKVSEYIQEFTLPVELPTQANVPENVHYFTEYQKVDPNVLDNQEKLHTICNGLFPTKQVVPILGILNKLNELDYAKLIKDENLCTIFVKSVTSIQDAHKHFIELLKVSNDNTSSYFVRMLIEKFNSSNIEDLTKFYELTHDALLNDIPNIGNHVFNKKVIQDLAVDTKYQLSKISDELAENLQELKDKWEEEGDENI